MKKLLFGVLGVLLLTTTAYAAALPQGWEGTLPSGITEAAERGDVLSGGVAWLGNTLRASLGDTLRSGVRDAALLTLAALICGAAEGLASGAEEPAARYVSYCGVLAVSALATGDLHALLGLGARTVDELGALAKLLLPAVSAAMASGGLVSTASVWQVTTLMVCDALCGAVGRLLLPLTYCCIAAAAAGAVLEESRLDRVSDGLSRLVTGALKLTLAVFTGYLTVAGVLTGSTDRAAVKAAKAAVSGAIPVVGGALGDAAESVLAAAGMLRGTVGALGVFAILAACVTPLVRLGVQYALYKLAAFAAGLAGTKALGDFLDRLGEAFALVFAMTASCALVLLAAMLVATAMVSG